MKRFIATLLSVLMVFGTVGISALAEEEGTAGELKTTVTEGEGDGLADTPENDEQPAAERPTATVTEIDVHEEDIDLKYALNFSADDATDEQLAAYGNWYADFVFTINKDAVFNANDENDGYLAGRYEAYNDGAWIKVPFEDMTVNANEPVKIMETAAAMMGKPGLKYTYKEVYDVVKDFGCGVHYSDAFLLANSDLTTTLELRIYNPEDESESYAIGKVYEFKVKTPSTEENVVVQGTKVTGSAVEIQNVNAESAAAGTTTVTINTNDFVEESETVVDTVKLPVAAIETVEALGEDATLNITFANGDGTDITVSINKAALTAIKEAADDATEVILKVDKAEEEELEAEQTQQVSGLNNNHVYTISFVTTEGTAVYPEEAAQEGKTIKVGIPYAKVGRGTVVAKYLKDDGTLEDVDFSYENGVVTLTLAHFSDYVIYQRAVSSSYSSSGGSSVSSKYTVRFDTDGGNTIASQNVSENDKVTEPTAPVKDGYIFEGWYTDDSFTTLYDFESAVEKGFTLYAKWTEEAETDEGETPDADGEETPDVDGEEATENAWFVDVAEADWYYDDVKYVSDNKLMNGVTDTTFAPDGLLTRGMLVTILYRNEGEPAVNRSIPFADVDMGMYYANAVIWAQQNGIVNGVTETEFAPDENITREQIAAIIYRYAISKGLEAVTMEENLGFADAAEISEYAISSMQWAVGSGLIKGKTESTINPKDFATRAEIAAILHRFIEAGK